MSARPESMRQFRSQATIAAPVSVQGFGFWSGRDVRVELRPAEVDTGIVFVRNDLESPVRIPARVDYRVESPRRTTISRGGVTVELVEHIMAALVGQRIDNCEVVVDAPEIPGLDGSSQKWVDALEMTERVETDCPRSVLRITEPVRVGTEDTWVEARPPEQGGFSAKVRIDYGSESAIGRQTYELEITSKSFREELAGARTFILKEEADWLAAQGLCQRVTCADVLVFSDEGPIDNELRYSNECVRHKMLDLVGDLALAGCDLVGHFVAHCSGHRLNAELVRVLLAEFSVVNQSRLSA